VLVPSSTASTLQLTGGAPATAQVVANL